LLILVTTGYAGQRISIRSCSKVHGSGPTPWVLARKFCPIGSGLCSIRHANFREHLPSRSFMNRGAKGDTLRKLCDDVQREGPAGCGAFQASIQPLYFMSGHDVRSRRQRRIQRLSRLPVSLRRQRRIQRRVPRLSEWAAGFSSVNAMLLTSSPLPGQMFPFLRTGG
jgi:hypothetical protein